MNLALLLGRLGQDPELRYTQSGRAVCTLRLATDEGVDGDGKERPPEWHRIIVWDKPGEAAGRHLVKGQRVHVEGRLRTREWEKDGERRWTTEVVARRVTFLDKPQGPRS